MTSLGSSDGPSEFGEGVRAAAHISASVGMLPHPPRHISVRELRSAAEPHAAVASRGLMVCVLAGHAGAGATSIAAALADAAGRDVGRDESGGARRVRLVDAAPPPWSGLNHSTLHDTAVLNGWRRGRRGSDMTVDRLHRSIEHYDLPDLEPAPETDYLSVVDVGVGVRELAVSPRRAALVARADFIVIVTRDTASALSQAEFALGEVGVARALIVLIRGRGRRRPMLIGAGTRLAELASAGGMVAVPKLPSRLVRDVSPAPSPAPLQVALMPLITQVRSTAASGLGEER